MIFFSKHHLEVLYFHLVSKWKRSQSSELKWASGLGQTFALCSGSAVFVQAEPPAIIFVWTIQKKCLRCMQGEAWSNGIVQTRCEKIQGWIFWVFFLFSSLNCLLTISLEAFYICFYLLQKARIFARIFARIRIGSHQRWGLLLVLVQYTFLDETCSLVVSITGSCSHGSEGRARPQLGWRARGSSRPSAGSGFSLLHPWTMPRNYLQEHGLPHFNLFFDFIGRKSKLSK